MTERIQTRKENGAGWLVFNNPARHNALSLDMWEAIPEVMADFHADEAVRVIVMTGAGDKAFVSGADISEFEQHRAAAEAIAKYDAASDLAFSALKRATKPTIAIIRGFCMGGGVGIALGCDLRIASDDARFGIPAAKLGLGYQFEPVQKLVATVGHAYAREILFTGRQFSAAEALGMGLVNRVLPATELEPFVEKYVAAIAGNAPLTIHAAKLAIDAACLDPADREMSEIEAAIARCMTSQDYAEGRQAFTQKRRPAFRGR